MNSEKMTDVIRRKLTDAFAPISLEIEDESKKHAGHAGARAGGESHFRVRIISAAFTGQNQVARHRAVYGALAEEMREKIHALALDTKTPQE